MKPSRIILNTAVVFALVMGMSACHEGPAEKAGEKVDKAMDNAGDKMEDMGKDVKEKAEGGK